MSFFTLLKRPQIKEIYCKAASLRSYPVQLSTERKKDIKKILKMNIVKG